MKPVAYISEGGILFKESPPDSMIKLTPLYAMRELTDEKIRDIFYTSPYLKKGETITYADFYFARAILQKASEK
jgi:hypothetical protein